VVFEYPNKDTGQGGPIWFSNQSIFLEIEEGCETVDSIKVVYERPASGYNRVDPAPGECDANLSSDERAYALSFAITNQPPVTTNVSQDEIEAIWAAATPGSNGLRVGWSGCRFVNNTAIHTAETVIRITEINGLPTGA
jgi:hypothetical protein